MFSLFKRKKREPAFATLQAYANKNFFFRRKASWSWNDQQTIFVVDPHGPRMITMDPWTQKVFLAADGQQTVSTYVKTVAAEYRGKIPEGLDDTIIYQVNALLQENLIELTVVQIRPDVQYDAPFKPSL